jgi:acyl-coenzyme A synthetase/AMP-(fatty) acid ligase
MVHQRWYTNGDIVRLDVHGNVLYLGKGDKQIQLAGKLLDLGEVNATLLKSNIDCGSCSASILEGGELAYFFVPDGNKHRGTSDTATSLI